MQSFHRAVVKVLLTALLSAGFLSLPSIPQTTADHSTQITTQERLDTESWWPTKSTYPLNAYAGSETCIRCHTEKDQGTSMQRAAAISTGSPFWTSHSDLAYKSSNITYALARMHNSLQLSASDVSHKVSQPLNWIIGAGDLGRTFLYQADGHWYQSQLSFYTSISALDITTGLGPYRGTSLQGALGQALSPQDARACFNCHTVHATTSAGLNPLHAEPGIGCEACHGPGRQHADAVTYANRKASPETGDSKLAIFNPESLSPSDSIDFCGSCHRTFADASLSTGPGVDTAVVRFQPYRLEESKCWRSTKDERLTCVACHNPHKPLNRDVASYDSKCLSCHANASLPTDHSVKACPKATSRCVSCHMQKVTIASMHGDFTDHFIRIVRDGENLPR